MYVPNNFKEKKYQITWTPVHSTQYYEDIFVDDFSKTKNL